MPSYRKSTPLSTPSQKQDWGGGGVYFEDFGGTLSEEFGYCGTSVTEMTVVNFEGFKISFPEIVDPGTVHRVTDFIGVFKEKCTEFTSNGTTNRRMQEPVLQCPSPIISIAHCKGGLLYIAECFCRDFFVHHFVTVHGISGFRVIMSSTTRGKSEFRFIICLLNPGLRGDKPESRNAGGR